MLNVKRIFVTVLFIAFCLLLSVRSFNYNNNYIDIVDSDIGQSSRYPPNVAVQWTFFPL